VQEEKNRGRAATVAKAEEEEQQRTEHDRQGLMTESGGKTFLLFFTAVFR